MKNVIVNKVKDGSFKVEIPMLNIITYAINEADVEKAVNEAIEVLKISAIKNGCVETTKLISLWYKI